MKKKNKKKTLLIVGTAATHINLDRTFSQQRRMTFNSTRNALERVSNVGEISDAAADQQDFVRRGVGEEEL